MMLAILGIFYATMVAAGYIIEFTFGGLGLIPAERAAKVTQTGIQWNYTTVLNIIFLLLAAALLVRFFRSGGRPMLKMMGGGPAGHEHHAHADDQPAYEEPSHAAVPARKRHADGRSPGGVAPSVPGRTRRMIPMAAGVHVVELPGAPQVVAGIPGSATRGLTVS
jgi:hypothetical protein